MLVQMVEPVKADLETHVRLWIKKDKKENSRLEFRLKVDLGTRARRRNSSAMSSL